MSQRRRYTKRYQWRKTYRNYSRFNPDNERQYYQYGVVPVTSDRYRRQEAEESRAEYYSGRSSRPYGYSNNAIREHLEDVRAERNWYRNFARQFFLNQRRSEPAEETSTSSKE